MKQRLPDERHSITHRAEVGGMKIFLTVGVYEDGRPGELFIRVNKVGSLIHGLFDTVAMLVSELLQQGVTVLEIAGKLEGIRFDPAGVTSNKQIPMAKSVIDYIGKWLTAKFPTKTKVEEVELEPGDEFGYEDHTGSQEQPDTAEL